MNFFRDLLVQLFYESDLPWCDGVALAKANPDRRRGQLSSSNHSPAHHQLDEMLFPDSFKPVHHQIPSPSSGSDAPPASIFALVHSPPPSTSSSAEPHRVLVFLHGYPQNHTLWHEMVRLLDESVLSKYHIVIPDLPGYGKSTKTPSPDGSHAANSKKEVANDIVALIDDLFSPTAEMILIGHDRGARVSYRLAKDWPERCKGICLMDIVPTKMVFDEMKLSNNRHTETFRSYHWIFLALPPPLPETLINASTTFYFTHTINSWTGKRYKPPSEPSKFHPEAFSSWVAQYEDPTVVQGALEDYRAGASIDLDHDEDGKAVVDCPILALYSVHLGRRFDVENVWPGLGKKGVRVKSVGDEETGHFLPVETSEECTKEVEAWLKTI